MTAPATPPETALQPTNAALALISDADMAKLEEIDRFVGSLDLDTLQGKGLVTQAMATGVAMQRLREMLTPFLPRIMALKDTALGFQTDRRPGTKNRKGEPVRPYPESVIVDCVLHALLDGMPLVGNCFNVIGGNYYATQNGLWFKLLERYRIEELKHSFGVVKMGANGLALVPCTRLSFQYQGRAFDLVADNDGDPIPIEVRINAGQGPDQAKGKAERKALNLIVKTLRGRPLPIGEIGDAEFREGAGGGGGVSVVDVGGGDPEASAPEEDEASAPEVDGGPAEPARGGGGEGFDPGPPATPAQIDRMKLRAREANMAEEDLIGLCIEVSHPYQPKRIEDVPASAVDAVLEGIAAFAAKVASETEQANGAQGGKTLGSTGRLEALREQAERMGPEGKKLLENVLLDAQRAHKVTNPEDIPASADTDILRSLSARVEGLKSSRRR